jgi:hypothetical protein
MTTRGEGVQRLDAAIGRLEKAVETSVARRRACEAEVAQLRNRIETVGGRLDAAIAQLKRVLEG